MMEKRKQRAGAQVGATAIEYGLIAALVAVVIITALTALGTSLNSKFSSVAATVQPAEPGSGGDEPPATPSASATPTATPETDEETSPGSPAVLISTPMPGEEGPRILVDTLCWLGPGPAYEVVSAVRAGSPVEVLGVGLGGGWLVVDNPHFPGAVCWVSIEAVALPDAFVPARVFSIPPKSTSTSEPKLRQGCLVGARCEVPCPVPGQYPVCYQ
jgi:pilus assembly protein Flp/PilA